MSFWFKTFIHIHAKKNQGKDRKRKGIPATAGWKERKAVLENKMQWTETRPIFTLERESGSQ